MPCNIKKKAFRACDGTAESVWFLQQLIRKHRADLSQLNNKAFDWVSHQSITLAAGQLGDPPPMLSYVAERFSDARTRIPVGAEISNDIRCACGES